MGVFYSCRRSAFQDKRDTGCVGRLAKRPALNKPLYIYIAEATAAGLSQLTLAVRRVRLDAGLRFAPVAFRQSSAASAVVERLRWWMRFLADALEFWGGGEMNGYGKHTAYKETSPTKALELLSSTIYRHPRRCWSSMIPDSTTGYGGTSSKISADWLHGQRQKRLAQQKLMLWCKFQHIFFNIKINLFIKLQPLPAERHHGPVRPEVGTGQLRVVREWYQSAEYPCLLRQRHGKNWTHRCDDWSAAGFNRGVYRRWRVRLLNGSGASYGFVLQRDGKV